MQLRSVASSFLSLWTVRIAQLFETKNIIRASLLVTLVTIHDLCSQSSSPLFITPARFRADSLAPSAAFFLSPPASLALSYLLSCSRTWTATIWCNWNIRRTAGRLQKFDRLFTSEKHFFKFSRKRKRLFQAHVDHQRILAARLQIPGDECQDQRSQREYSIDPDVPRTVQVGQCFSLLVNFSYRLNSYSRMKNMDCRLHHRTSRRVLEASRNCRTLLSVSGCTHRATKSPTRTLPSSR